MAKYDYRATFFGPDDCWEDSEDGFDTEVAAVARGKQYLSGAKDGSHVVIDRIESIKRLERGSVLVKPLK